MHPELAKAKLWPYPFTQLHQKIVAGKADRYCCVFTFEPIRSNRSLKYAWQR